MRQLALICAAVLLGTASASAKSAARRVMVLDLPSDPSISDSALKTLDHFIASAVKDQGFEVITPDQVSAILGLERTKQLLGCSESDCMAELGGALGVDYIVSGTLAVLGKDSALTLTLIDKTGAAVASQRHIVAGREVEGFIPALEKAVPALMAPANGANPPVLTPNAPGSAENDALELKNGPETEKKHPSGAYFVAGGGVLAVAAGVLVGLSANSSSNAYENDVRTGRDATSDASSTRTKAISSTVLVGAGLAAIAGGAAWWFYGAEEGR